MAYSSQYQTTIRKLLEDYGNGGYNSEYQDRINDSADRIANYGDYQSDYADRITDLTNRINDYGDYTSKWQPQMDSTLNSILNRGDFKYNYEEDPSYLAYKDQYTRLGSRAMEDTLGQMAARTGGLASSYAGSAAQDSYNNYMQALSDIIPTLEQNAYSRWQDEGNNLRNNFSLLQGLDATDYGRWQDTLANLYNNLSMNQNLDATDYARWQDALANLYNENGMWLGMEQNAFNQWQGQRGDQLDYISALQKQDEIDYDRWLTDLQMAMAAARSSGGSGGSGRSSSGSSGSGSGKYYVSEYGHVYDENGNLIYANPGKQYDDQGNVIKSKEDDGRGNMTNLQELVRPRRMIR